MKYDENMMKSHDSVIVLLWDLSRYHDKLVKSAAVWFGPKALMPFWNKWYHLCPFGMYGIRMYGIRVNTIW